MRRIFWYLASALLLAFPIQAKQVIRGQVRDAATGEGLALATVQVEGTYRGTIANEDGKFVLELSELPVVVRFTCIGYQSAQVAIEELPAEELDVRLTPAPFVMEETVVTGEDPAVRIMREVIRRKQEWRPLIQSYRVEAYARRVLENDTSIVVMGEIASEIFWEREKGFREVIKSRRATANMDGEGFNFGSTEDFVNLYDDDIEIIDNQVIGPTHPDALRHYEFELVGQRRMDDRIVYDISLKPRSRLQTAFVGKVAVLDEEFGLLEVELTPVETITASIPIPIFEQFDIEYKQQFRPFAQGVWLPVDFRYEIRIKIGMIGLHFPLIKIRALTQLADYQVNTVLPDSVSKEREEGWAAPLVTSESSTGAMVEKHAQTDKTRIDTASSGMTIEIPTQAEDGQEDTLSAGVMVEKHAQMERVRIDTALSVMTADERAQTEDRQGDTPSAGMTVELHAQTERVRVDTQAVRSDSLFILLKDRIPLSVREQEAYTTIDSSMNLDEAFRPTGFLARFVKGDEEERERRKERHREREAQNGQEAGGAQVGKGNPLARLKPDFRPELWFNRVEEGHLGLKAGEGLPGDLWLSAEGGYATGLERWFYGAGLRRAWGEKERGWAEVAFRRGPRTRYLSDSYRPVLTSALPLLGFADYFDYCWSEGFGIEIGYKLKENRRQVALKFADERYTSLEKSTDFDLLGRSQLPRDNPAVDAGRLRSLTVRMALGGPYHPFGVTANRRLSVEIEYAASWLGGDFSFTRYGLVGDWHAETFFKRRLAPNALDLRLVAGTATGELPLQRFGVLDTALGPFTPFGALRAVRDRPYEGEQYAALFWEHNFKTVPFEVLGLWELVRRGFGLVAHGASGRTWIPETRRETPGYEPRYAHGFYHEAGVSLILYHFARLDVTRRLDRKGWRLGASIARFDFD